ncbi:hypothetical protein Slin15195_G016570 [Septoria linicola]|uniref:Uncharacterized protein n=1 Tax=Septoria linicola TaxID=215465 RepID=A0A9Q9AK18_9PEZI|nr:hypothetical protein Slin14017_G016640 [Septoria linicola]USW48338.1 hypothetical protein Slin15195_G016570 [Septoria linicola]
MTSSLPIPILSKSRSKNNSSGSNGSKGSPQRMREPATCTPPQKSKPPTKKNADSQPSSAVHIPSTPQVKVSHLHSSPTPTTPLQIRHNTTATNPNTPQQ